jgi:hypothetical protein
LHLQAVWMTLEAGESALLPQAVQSSDVAAFAAPEFVTAMYLPVSQGVQTVLPCPDLNPAAQEVQAVALGALLNLPTAHCWSG